MDNCNTNSFLMLRAQQPTRIGYHDQGQTEPGETTGVPCKFTAQFLLLTADAAIQTCKRRQNVPYFSCGRQSRAHIYSSKSRRFPKTGSRRLSHTTSPSNYHEKVH